MDTKLLMAVVALVVLAAAFTLTPRAPGFPTSDLTKQDISITVYVPSTKDVSQPIPAAELTQRVDETVAYLTSLFGGTTTIPGRGTWEGITEDVVLVNAHTTSSDYLSKDAELGNWLREKKAEWGQDSLAFEYEGTLYLI